MTIQFDPNVSKAINARSGFGFWRMKELLVACGQWTVIGSGDGGTHYAYLGVTAALAPGNQGSGGDYDALKTGSGLGTLVASDWSTGGWCVLRDSVGREILFVDSTSSPDASWGSYGRIAYSRSAGFVGAGVGVATIPGAAADEQWIYGARATPAGVEVFDNGAAGYIHLYAHDAPTNGFAGFGWAAATTTGNMGAIMLASATREHDANADPVMFVVAGATGKAWASPTTAYAYWSPSVSLTQVPVTSLPVEPQGGGKECLTPAWGYASVSSPSAITSADCGYPIDYRSVRFTSSRNHPDVEDCAATSTTWILIGVNVCMPWPSSAVIPLSGTSVVRNGVEYLPTSTIGDGVVPVSQDLVPTEYFQRVWDITNTRWCQFTKNTIDPNPDPSETSPVHSGSITGHSILKVTVG